MADVMQIVTTRGFGQYVTPGTEIHNIFYHRLDPLSPSAKTGVILAHGFFGNGDSFNVDTGDGPFRELVERIVMYKIPTIATDLGGGSTWGNETLVSRLNTTITYFNAITGARTDRVILLGVSMGAASVLNWIRNWANTGAGSGNDFANRNKVAAVVLLAPSVDLQDIVNNNRGGLGGAVSGAYSGYTGGWATQAPTANPANYASGYASVPIRIWYSTNDSICVPATITAFATGSGATLTSLGAIGHSASTLDAQQLADWVAGYA